MQFTASVGLGLCSIWQSPLEENLTWDRYAHQLRISRYWNTGWLDLSRGHDSLEVSENDRFCPLSEFYQPIMNNL